ncbi:hypothetical protein FB45DRAFT_1065094 [Roridomyces roridus]|uniref:Uncharacterized protein n=1 Tax=Roridomyces roridus TaxID=1738132 RepID=A0AAD7B8W0_9AGAR|nr:hypothetical protein FB45DRAFT_1065094 [Roridomyces roridus]
MAADDNSVDVVLFSYPRLPLDLERTIFEISALSRPRRIPNLMLVAQRVCTWVEPLMYRVVYLDYADVPDGMPPFTWSIFMRLLVTKPPEFFRNSVKHLLLGSSSLGSLQDDIRLILRTCTGITGFFDFQGVHASKLNFLDSLQRVTVNLSDLFSIQSSMDFSSPVFRNITHLEILDDAPKTSLACIAQLPHLTHFAFNTSNFCVRLATEVLPTCSAIECIVFLSHPDDAPGLAVLQALLDDERFVPIWQSDCIADWHRGATGGVDYQVVAEGFIQARRTRKIQSITRYISDDDMSWYQL